MQLRMSPCGSILQLITQTPGTATVIRNSHDRGIDPDRFFTLANSTFQTGEQRRKPCATADCYKLLTSVFERSTRLGNHIIGNC